MLLDCTIDNLKEKIKENERHSFLLDKKSIALNKDVNEINNKLEIFKNVMSVATSAGQFEVMVSKVIMVLAFINHSICIFKCLYSTFTSC